VPSNEKQNIKIACTMMIKKTQQLTYSIGDLSKEFDITTRSIRFYEDQGLLLPARKGQTRIYNQRDRVRLKLVLRGKRLGFSLAETGRLFELYDTDKSSATQLPTMMDLISQKRTDLNQQLEDIKAVLFELDDLEKNCIESLKKVNSTNKSK
jgi:DNA-binding transcriptional MerR regulator